MTGDYQKLLDASAKKKNENKKFFDRLRKTKPADLDTITNRLHDEAFENIDCLKCANCCATTGPLLLNKDIDRLAAHFKERPSVFADKYLNIDGDGDYVFKSLPCPFLNIDHYCSVYESRPNACREFPHTQQRNIYQKLKITLNNTLVCPAVAAVAEGLKKHYNK